MFLRFKTKYFYAMENFVQISLDEYNELHAFKREVEAGKVCRIIRTGAMFDVVIFLPATEAMEELEHADYQQAKQINDIETKNNHLRKALELTTALIGFAEDHDEKVLQSLQRMNIFQFLKWKHSKS